MGGRIPDESKPRAFECKSVETSEKEDKMEKQFALEIIYCDD